MPQSSSSLAEVSQLSRNWKKRIGRGRTPRLGRCRVDGASSNSRNGFCWGTMQSGEQHTPRGSASPDSTPWKGTQGAESTPIASACRCACGLHRPRNPQDRKRTPTRGRQTRAAPPSLVAPSSPHWTALSTADQTWWTTKISRGTHRQGRRLWAKIKKTRICKRWTVNKRAPCLGLGVFIGAEVGEDDGRRGCQPPPIRQAAHLPSSLMMPMMLIRPTAVSRHCERKIQIWGK